MGWQKLYFLKRGYVISYTTCHCEQNNYRSLTIVLTFCRIHQRSLRFSKILPKKSFIFLLIRRYFAVKRAVFFIKKWKKKKLFAKEKKHVGLLNEMGNRIAVSLASLLLHPLAFYVVESRYMYSLSSEIILQIIL